MLSQDLGPIRDADAAGSDVTQTRSGENPGCTPATQVGRGGTNRWYLELTKLERKEIRAKIWCQDDEDDHDHDHEDEEEEKTEGETSDLMERITAMEEEMKNLATSEQMKNMEEEMKKQATEERMKMEEEMKKHATEEQLKKHLDEKLNAKLNANSDVMKALSSVLKKFEKLDTRLEKLEKAAGITEDREEKADPARAAEPERGEGDATRPLSESGATRPLSESDATRPLPESDA